MFVSVDRYHKKNLYPYFCFCDWSFACRAIIICRHILQAHQHLLRRFLFHAHLDTSCLHLDYIFLSMPCLHFWWISVAEEIFSPSKTSSLLTPGISCSPFTSFLWSNTIGSWPGAFTKQALESISYLSSFVSFPCLHRAAQSCPHKPALTSFPCRPHLPAPSYQILSSNRLSHLLHSGNGP